MENDVDEVIQQWRKTAIACRKDDEQLEIVRQWAWGAAFLFTLDSWQRHAFDAFREEVGGMIAQSKMELFG